MLKFARDQCEVVELYLRRLVAWLLFTFTTVATLTVCTSLISPSGQLLSLVPSVHVLLLVFALCLSLLTLTGLLFGDLSVFVAPRSLYRSVQRSAGLASSAALVGAAMGLILHRILEIRWANTYGHHGSIANNVFASLKLLLAAGSAAKASPAILQKGAADTQSAFQRFADLLSSQYARSAGGSAQSLANQTLASDDYFRSPFGIVLCMLCGAASLLALYLHYESSNMREKSATLKWEAGESVDKAFAWAEMVRDCLTGYARLAWAQTLGNLVRGGPDDLVLEAAKCREASSRLRRALLASRLYPLMRSVVAVALGSLAVLVVGRLGHANLGHLPLERQPLLLPMHLLFSVLDALEGLLLSIYKGIWAGVGRAVRSSAVSIGRSLVSSASADSTHYVSTSGGTCQPVQSTPASPGVSASRGDEEHGVFFLVGFTLAKASIRVVARTVCAFFSLCFNHTYPFSLWVSLCQSAATVSFCFIAPVAVHSAMLAFLRIPVRFFRLRETGSMGALNSALGRPVREADEALLAAVQCGSVYAAKASKGWWTGASVVRSNFSSREDVTKAQAAHFQQMVKDSRPESIGPACSPALSLHSGYAISQNLPALFRALALQDLVAIFEEADDEGVYGPCSLARRQLFQGRWNEIAFATTAIIDATRLQLQLFAAHVLVDILAGTGEQAKKLPQLNPPVPSPAAPVAAIPMHATSDKPLLTAGNIQVQQPLTKPHWLVSMLKPFVSRAFGIVSLLPLAPTIGVAPSSVTSAAAGAASKPAAAKTKACESAEEVAQAGRKKRLANPVFANVDKRYGKAPGKRTPGLLSILDSPLFRAVGRSLAGLRGTVELPAFVVQTSVLACATLASGLDKALSDDLGGTAGYFVPSVPASLASLLEAIEGAKAALEKARGAEVISVPRIKLTGQALLDAAEQCADLHPLERLDLLSDAAEDALSCIISSYGDVLKSGDVPAALRERLRRL